MGNMKQKFEKPFLRYDQQIAQLKKRGMKINDEKFTTKWLEYVTYYRLSPYWKQFESESDHKKEPSFPPGKVSFEMIVELYEFDRQLRLLIWSAVERIEIALRGNWAYQIARKFGPKGYQNQNLLPW